MIHTLTGHPETELGIVALILAVMGIIIIIGKGDKLIAGYNTMSKRRRGMYHIRRIRIVIAGMLWVCAGYVFTLVRFAENMKFVTTSSFIFGIVILTAVVLCSTWAKRR